jgi:hypothetical protein
VRTRFEAMPELHYTPTEFHLTPSIVIVAGLCEDECCGDVHAVQLICQWFWWGFSVLLWEQGD